MYLRELSRSKFHSVTSSNVILYNDAKNSIFIKSGFNTFWKWALQLLQEETYYNENHGFTSKNTVLSRIYYEITMSTTVLSWNYHGANLDS